MFWNFLDQNRGLSPSENCDFWSYEKWAFLWSKNVSFLFRTWRNSIFNDFDEKQINKNFEYLD